MPSSQSSETHTLVSILTSSRASEVSIRELVDRGYYIGSNVTYNVRHLVDTGYLMQNRSERDQRSVRIHATEKGRELCQGLREMEMRHASSINVESEDADSARNYLRGLERVWSDSIQFGRA